MEDSWVVSKLVVLLLFVGSCESFNGHLIKALEGFVGAENFTYYTYSDSGPLLVVLESLSGDADLYISASTKKPTYLDYDVKSTTCGQDMVNLSQLKRPVYIGVYGSHAFEISDYVLYAYRPYLDPGLPDSTDTDTESEDSYRNVLLPSDTDEPSISPFFEFLLYVLEFLIQVFL